MDEDSSLELDSSTMGVNEHFICPPNKKLNNIKFNGLDEADEPDLSIHRNYEVKQSGDFLEDLAEDFIQDTTDCVISNSKRNNLKGDVEPYIGLDSDDDSDDDSDGVLEAENEVLEADDGVLEADDGVLEAGDGVLEAGDRVLEADDGVLEAGDVKTDVEGYNDMIPDSKYDGDDIDIENISNLDICLPHQAIAEAKTCVVNDAEPDAKSEELIDTASTEPSQDENLHLGDAGSLAFLESSKADMDAVNEVFIPDVKKSDDEDDSETKDNSARLTPGHSGDSSVDAKKDVLALDVGDENTATQSQPGLMKQSRQSIYDFCHAIQTKIMDRPPVSPPSSGTDVCAMKQHPNKEEETGNNFTIVQGEKVELRPKKSSAKRVNSIRQSLIKLGSFGKESGKPKKEKHKSGSSEPKSSKGSISEVEGGASVSHNSGHNPKSPEPRSPGLPITSPTTPSQNRISNPLAVDSEKLQQCYAEKLSTIQLMYHAVQQEYEILKVEYQRNQTEQNHSNLEAKGKVMRRLAAQIDQQRNNSGAPGDRNSCLPLNESEMPPPSSTYVPITAVNCDLRRGNGMDSTSSLDEKKEYSSSLDENRDYPSGLPPHPRTVTSKLKCSTTGVNPALPDGVQTTKKEVLLSRSHSDSYRRTKRVPDDTLRQAASTDELALISSCDVRKRFGNLSRSRSKSQEAASDEMSDSTGDQLHPLPEELSPTSMEGSHSDNSLTGIPNLQQPCIIALDDYDFDPGEENFVEKEGPFCDFNRLKKKPAHLAVFLHYLISNSDPLPLLFYIATENYAQGSGKELRKWTYEIYSTFLADTAPLKLNIDQAKADAIKGCLQNKLLKEDRFAMLFQETRDAAMKMINELLADFRTKLSLGLGSIYGEHELEDKMSHPAEMKVVENYLWTHFVFYAKEEENERNAAMLSALGTFFKQIGYANNTGNLLERYPSFNTKDKSKFPMFSSKSNKKLLSQTTAEHHLQMQQYVTLTYCNVCRNLLCGVGCQGFQCSKCEQNFHKNCLNAIKEPCSKKQARQKSFMDRSKGPSNVFKNIVRKPSQLSTSAKEQQDVGSILPPVVGRAELPSENELDPLESRMERTISLPSVREVKGVSSTKSSISSLIFGDRESFKEQPSVGLQRGDTRSSNDFKSLQEDYRSRSPEPPNLTSDEHHENQVSENVKTPPSITSSLSIRSVAPDTISISSELAADSDFDTEAELPSLDRVIPKEFLKKLKPKEKKRQDVINELFHTEKAHVRNLKVMKRLFYLPMQSEPQHLDLLYLLFPNIDDIILVHSNLNKDFKERKNQSEHSVVTELADILVKHLCDEGGDKFKEVCAKFCEKQSHALELLKSRQRKDQKLATLLQEQSSNSLCRRLELKDLLPTAMQRLTKYPLLISSLLKYTQNDTDEYGKLQLALDASKVILNHVNRAVQEHENHLKLVEMQKRLDKRPIENSTLQVLVDNKNLDLTRHKLIFDGPLTWRFSKDRTIQLHVVLLENILLLLTKQDDRLVLRCHSKLIAAGDTKMMHSPILRLTNLLIKPVATDTSAFFLVSTVIDTGPQIYDLVAGSKDEKNKWCNRITEAVDAFRINNPEIWEKSQKKLGKHSTEVSPSAPADGLPENIVADDRTSLISIQDNNDNQHLLEEQTKSSNRSEIDESMSYVPSANEFLSNDDTFLEPLEKLKQTDELIHRMMAERKKLLIQMQLIPEEDDYEPVSVVDQLNSRSETTQRVFSLITLVENFSHQLVQNSLESNNASVGPTGTVDVPTGTVDVPTSAVDVPTSTADVPTSTADVPTSTADVPTGTVDMPTGTVDVPSFENAESRTVSNEESESLTGLAPSSDIESHPSQTSKEPQPSISISHLLSFNRAIHEQLNKLLEVVVKTEDEKLHLMEKLNLAEDQVSALMLQKDNESSSRPVSFISVTSSNSETGECLLQGEQKELCDSFPSEICTVDLKDSENDDSLHNATMETSPTSLADDNVNLIRNESGELLPDEQLDEDSFTEEVTESVIAVVSSVNHPLSSSDA